MNKNVYEKNPFVAIGASLGGILLTIILLLMIFAKDIMVSVIGTIVWGLVVLGIAMGIFALKAHKK